MNEIDLAVLGIIEDFKNYPEIEAAWNSLSVRHEEIFEQWRTIVSDELAP